MPKSEPGSWFRSTRGARYGIGRVPDVIGALAGAGSWLTAAHRRASPHLTGRTIGPQGGRSGFSTDPKGPDAPEHPRLRWASRRRFDPSSD
jgi:hypothetical protein